MLVGRWFLLVPFFYLVPIVAFAANQNVDNTNDTGAGSLRQAVVDVGAGEDVSFQPAVAGGTINLESNLDVTKSMNFVNRSEGSVTTDFGGNRMSVTNGSTIALDSDLTFQTSTSSDAYTVYANDGLIDRRRNRRHDQGKLNRRHRSGDLRG